MESRKTETVTGICTFCLKSENKYTCPRCNAGYCSVDCYRGEKHQQCSEAFYRDCFMEGLKEMENSKDGKEKVLEMLKRIQGQTDESGEDLDDDLHERLAGLDLDNDGERIWSKLTAKEQMEFQEMLHDGRLGSLVEKWQPWWLQSAPLVVDITEDASGDSSKQIRHPEIKKDLANISSLLHGKEPSICVQYSVLNILYGYVYITRLYNGDYLTSPLECAECVISISKALQQGSFSSPEEAVSDCILSVQDKGHAHFVSTKYSVVVLEDVIKLISGRDALYAMASLSDLWELFRAAKREVARFSAVNSVAAGQSEVKEPPMQHHVATLKEQKQKLHAVQKKLEFLIAWCKDYGDQLNSHVPSIQLEFCRRSTNLAAHEDVKTKLEKQWGGSMPPAKPQHLVEEL